jgi:hypothetical protein
MLSFCNFTGCMRSTQAPAKAPLSQPLIHTIHFSGENLSLVALWYTGKTNNWKEILAANPKLTPDRLKQGTQIKIPGTLVKRRDVLPRSFLNTHLGMTTSTQKSGNSETALSNDSKSSPEKGGPPQSTGANSTERVILTGPSKETEQRRKAVLEELLN